jgi:hypothetical protein
MHRVTDRVVAVIYALAMATNERASIAKSWVTRINGASTTL